MLSFNDFAARGKTTRLLFRAHLGLQAKTLRPSSIIHQRLVELQRLGMELSIIIGFMSKCGDLVRRRCLFLRPGPRPN